MIRKQKLVQLDASDIVVRGFTYALVSLMCLAALIPFVLIISSSFSSEDAIRMTGFTIWPKDFSTYAYELLFKSPRQLVGAYILTITMALVGTGVGLFVISMTGYALQRKDFPWRNGITFFIYFSSLFSVGLIPFYMTMTQIYHLKDNYLAILLPLMMNPWLVILMKNFAKAVPNEVTESGKIDGAGDFTVFTQLILPMLKPALATIGLFLAIGYWNEWYYSSLFLSSNVEFRPLQYQLYRVINQVAALKNSVAGSVVTLTNIPSETLKMATAVLATGPIILVYPFVQKYFVSGIAIGAVKG